MLSSGNFANAKPHYDLIFCLFKPTKSIKNTTLMLQHCRMFKLKLLAVSGI